MPLCDSVLYSVNPCWNIQCHTDRAVFKGAGLRDQLPKCSPPKFLTVFQHICAVKVLDLFLFMLQNRCVTFKSVCGRAAYNTPHTPSQIGSGQSRPMSLLDSFKYVSRSWRLVSVNQSEIFLLTVMIRLHTRPGLYDWIVYPNSIIPWAWVGLISDCKWQPDEGRTIDIYGCVTVFEKLACVCVRVCGWPGVGCALQW